LIFRRAHMAPKWVQPRSPAGGASIATPFFIRQGAPKAHGGFSGEGAMPRWGATEDENGCTR
jgi:hypothetical protein